MEKFYYIRNMLEEETISKNKDQETSQETNGLEERKTRLGCFGVTAMLS